MFTIFHLIALLCVIGGTVIGAGCGWHWFGWAGLVVGSVIGIAAGIIMGTFPLVAATSFFSRKFVHMNSKELWEHLHADDCLTPNLVLLELNYRGEDVSTELPNLFSRLTSDNSNDRAKALASMNSLFPELVEKIPEYDPFATTQDCRKHADPIKVAIDAASTKATAGDAAESATDE